MWSMTAASISKRDAPGPLRLVQDFLNTPAVEPTDGDLHIARAIRSARRRGSSQAAVAAQYGVSQQLVSAILRSNRTPGAPTLGSAGSARRWLISCGLMKPDGGLSHRQYRHILELRSALLALALANNGSRSAKAIMTSLDRLAAGVPLLVTFGGAEAQASLAPARSREDSFIGVILAAVYDAMLDGRWARLKACPAERCQHVFYDTSRNRTSTWCSMSICGNRTKVRNYQERRRNAREP